MASVTVDSSAIGKSLASILLAGDIKPGDEPSYEMCKQIYLFHPLGQKMAESPIKMAQFKARKISVTAGPEEELVQAFEDQWRNDGVTETIKNVATLARVYGISSLSVLQQDIDPAEPLDPNKLADCPISFNVLDPLNTAGSLVLNQNPNAMDFLKHGDIAVNGKRYHRSRTITLINEQPIYIAYTDSAFGFVGRSVYQRALFPLKSFIQTMIADDMVSRKVGLLVATLKMASSVVDAVMRMAASMKRSILKLGATENVLSIAEGESVQSLDLTNIDGPLTTSRKNIVENIASACDMPANILKHESFAEGFGEGTEDAKMVAAYLEGIRTWLERLYQFMDMIIQRRAWNERFFEVIKAKYPDAYGKKSYEQAFYEWVNAFKSEWPPLIQEPESEMVRIADTKLKAGIALVQVLMPEVDPENKVKVLEWLEGTINAMSEWFPQPLELDWDALRQFNEEQKAKQEAMEQQGMGGEDGEEGEAGGKAPPPPAPFSARDSSVSAYLSSQSVGDLPVRVTRIEDHLRRLR